MKKMLFAVAMIVGSFSAQAYANVDAQATAPMRTEANAVTTAGRTAHGEGCTPEGAYIQWQCGARPTGSGWVRVAPTCWHRDTGRRCR